MQRRTPKRRPLPDLVGGRGFLTRRDSNHRRTKCADGGRPEQPRDFLYQGISSGPSSGSSAWRTMSNVQVKGAAFDNGLLQIEMVREIPEAMKPRRISIAGSSASNVQQIDAKAA